MRIGTIFLAGAAKAGTTTLYQVLSRHPEICSPLVKEPNFYSLPEWKTDREIQPESHQAMDWFGPGKGPGDHGTVWTPSAKQYHSYYRIGENHRFRIDGSVSYLYSPSAARRIRADFPDARILIILRNPVDRAWSHYKHLIRDGREKRPFEEALRLETERMKMGWEFSWHLRNMGLYSEQLARYFRYFGKDQVKVFLFEELHHDFGTVVRAATDFIGLRPFDTEPQAERDNVSGQSRSVHLARMVNWAAGYKVMINKMVGPTVTHTLMQKFRAMNRKDGEWTLNSETREELTAWFREDIEKTEQLTGKDLSAWKK